MNSRTLMLFCVLTAAVAVACGASPATQKHIVITDLPLAAGDYYLLLRRLSDGSVTVVRIPQKQVISLGDPPDTPVPPDDGFAALRAAVMTATENVSDANAAATKRSLAQLYSSLAGLPFQTRDALQKSTDLMFAALRLPDTWDLWKVALDDALSRFAALPEAKKAWKVVAEVLSRE